ncbi:MAG: 3-phosphoshikimate 1-carboxyvinyltransferase, partial [Planctomycetes bacterium]|nr:3-phosphoshikimate 1-carboxyvinyltransferase [Planctomycetota bacterium]
RLTGLETLEGKESPRLSVLAEALFAVGCAVETTPGSIRVAPGTRTSGELVLDPRNDHRMAFAFALLGLEREDLRVQNPACVAKSWPSFWTDLA